MSLLRKRQVIPRMLAANPRRHALAAAEGPPSTLAQQSLWSAGACSPRRACSRFAGAEAAYRRQAAAVQSTSAPGSLPSRKLPIGVKTEKNK